MDATQETSKETSQKSTQKATQKPSPKKRSWIWVILVLVILNFLAITRFAPVMPHVHIAAEPVAGPFMLPLLGEFYITNTILHTLLIDLGLIAIGLYMNRALRHGDIILSGFAGVIEAILEMLYDLVESIAGKRARLIYPSVATFIILIVVVNWSEMIPGVESIGLLHEVHAEEAGYPTKELFKIGDLSVATLTKETSEDVLSGHERLYGYTPLFRVGSTDLNFTVALAIASVLMTQAIGIKAVGFGYLEKFFPFGDLFRIWSKKNRSIIDFIMPPINIFVGILELAAEFAKIISFSFRLFGNIFAGSVLLCVIGALVPVVAQSGFIFLEMFVGFMQAIIFGMLTLVFMTIAVQPHGGHNEEHEALP